jgi:hypothetical protein
MTKYLKLIGATDWPLHEQDHPFTKYPSFAAEVPFPKIPNLDHLGRGDELMYYAVGGTKRVFGIVSLTESPTPKYAGKTGPVDKRWPNAADCVGTPWSSWMISVWHPSWRRSVRA